MMPLRLGPASFQASEYLVMRIVCGQVQTEVESRRAQQPEQRGKGGLPLIALICRDHRDGDSGPLSQFTLAHAGFNRASCNNADDGYGSSSASSS
jgi:hypothetical protein